MNRQEFAAIASKKCPGEMPPVNPLLELCVEKSVSYLASDAALVSLDQDPYWPKWCSPWWHMMLLWELNFASRIPSRTIEQLVQKMDEHYLKFFPFRLEEIPAGADPVRHILCHCALGCAHQLLFDYGVDVDARLPWVREWYFRYQLEDGALNCDEQAYTTTRRGSIVSTVPPLEAILHCSNRGFSDEEIAFLDRGAHYLLERKLIRSRQTDQLIDKSWLNLCFPRFYHYDMLRGLNYVFDWALKLKRKIALSSFEECVARIDAAFPDTLVSVGRRCWSDSNSSWYDPEKSEWYKAPAGTFALLELVGEPGSFSADLTRLWSEARKKARLLLELDLLDAD